MLPVSACQGPCMLYASTGFDSNCHIESCDGNKRNDTANNPICELQHLDFVLRIERKNKTKQFSMTFLSYDKTLMKRFILSGFILPYIFPSVHT